MRARSRLPLLMAGVGLAALVAAALPGEEQRPAGVLASQDTNVSGVVAEFTECKVKEGVLSVKIRLRNAGKDKAKVAVIENRDFDKYYVTAGSKKYFVLRDSEKVPLTPQATSSGNLAISIDGGGSWTWWAKYPAPPDSETKINYMWPLGAPFEDVPISR